MAMSTSKLARVVSNRVAGEVEHAVHVRWGFGMNRAAQLVVLVLLMVAAQVLRVTVGFTPGLSLWAVVVALGAGLRWRKTWGEAVLARYGDKIIVIEAHMLKRNPVRDIFREYPPQASPVFEPAKAWWRSSTITIGDDTWYVASEYKADAERWFTPGPSGVF